MSEIKSEVCFILDKLGMSEKLNIHRDTNAVKELLLLIKRDTLCEAFIEVMADEELADEEYDVVTTESDVLTSNSEDEEYTCDIESESESDNEEDLIEEEYQVTLTKKGFYEMSECNTKNNESDGSSDECD